MPFDSTDFVIDAPVETVERQRVRQLRDFLAVLPAEKFDISDWHQNRLCGTTACIGGWAEMLFYGEVRYRDGPLAEHMGLTKEQSERLFFNIHRNDGRTLRTLTDAVAVLDHYLSHGEIDWSVA